MKKKKILVQGTLDSLKKFFSDAVSNDYDVVAVISDDPEKISPIRNGRPIDVLATKNVPAFILRLIDGIIFTGNDKSSAEIFLRQGIDPKKIILWDAAQGWLPFGGREPDGTQVVFFCGLEFHIRSEDDAKFFNETVQRLQIQRQVKNLNPQLYPIALMQDYQRRMGRPFDFNNPRTFTEKLQWIKILDATPIKSRLADKYSVRRWVADKIGEQYLIPLLGVWDNFDDINFGELPDQFVLKCNHGAGMNIIVRDKKSFDRQQAREKLNAWLAYDFGTRYFQLHYTRINRKIIAEKFIARNDLPCTMDYKLYLFDGHPYFCQVETRHPNDHWCLDYFDMEWNVKDFSRVGHHPTSDHPEKIRRPKNFKLMKKLATTLAEGFAFVRVDFYEIDGKVYFGEMTFTPGAGNFYYKSEGTDEYLGSLLKLPNPTPPPRLF